MKMKFTIQKIIATMVVAAITFGIFPKILGNDKVNAAGSHSITVENGKAYTDDTYATELTSAEAGADVYLKETNQSGKYVTGWTSGQVTVGEASRFTMPDEDVSVKPIFELQTEYTIDLSGTVQVTDEDVLWNFLWSQGKASLSSLPGSYDLDTDGNVDIDVTYTGGVAEFTLASTCNFSGVIVAATDALTGKNLPYKITFNVPTAYTEYPLWVGNVQVTSDNKDNILGDGGKAKYDPSTNTLTLNDPEIAQGNGHEYGVIYSEGIDLTIEGSADLNGDSSYYGIWVEKKAGNGGNLTLNGSFAVNGKGGIYAYDTLTISGGTINAKAEFNSSPDAISADHVVITGGTINISDTATGIYARNDITVSGGTVNAHGTACGILTEQLTVNDGTVNVVGGSEGIRAPSDTLTIDVNGGALSVTSTNSSGKAIDDAITNVTININAAGYTVTDGATDGQFFRISQPSSVTYPVWVGGIKVTGDNKDDILGDGGKAKYDPDTNTLTLNDPLFIGTHENALVYSEGIDLTLEGSATFSSSSSGAIKVVKSGTYGGVLTLDGDFNIDNVAYDTSAIWADKGINVTGGKITNCMCYHCLKTDGDITISGGTVNASGSACAIYAENDISITGGTVEAKSNGHLGSGIVARNSLLISSGKVRVTNADNGIIGTSGVTVSGGTININVEGTVENNYALGGSLVNITGGNITAVIGTGCAIHSNGDMIISQATVIAASGKGNGIEVWGGQLEIKSGTVSAVGEGTNSKGIIVAGGIMKIGDSITKVSASGDSDGINCSSKIKLGEALNITTPAGGKLSSDGTFIAESDGTTHATAVVIVRDPSLYPVFVVISTWDINNNSISEVGGTVTGAPTTAKKGDTIEVTVTPNEGYEIVEISFGDGLIGTQTGMSPKFTVPSDYAPLTDAVQIDVIFRATTPSTYTVTFNTYGGSAVAAQTVTAGAKAAKPADPAKSGFTFDGWYKDPSFGTVFDFSTAINSDVTVYAKWKENSTTPSTYTVTFNTNGGNAVAAQTVTAGAKATKPADPAKSGFTFDGWYKDPSFGTTFDFSTAINSDVTVYAKWKENSTTPSTPTTPVVYYTVVSGANGTCTQGVDFVMQIKRSENDEKTYSDYFTGVKIDDKLLVNGTDYTAAPGSVIVTIKGATLQNLSVGGHTVTVEFKDGTAITSLNVKAAANVVKTGEDMSLALWTGVVCVSSAVMLFAAVVVQKKRTAVRQTVRKSVMKF